MPVISCPECDKDVSDSAAACPNCGYPIRRSVSGAGLWEAAGSVLVIISVLIYIGVLWSNGLRGHTTGVMIGTPVATVGFVVFLIGRFRS
jgi:hypothetical protein